MGERYVKVFGCDENLFFENAPVIIRAGALLKDTETGRMIAQLKIQNVSGKIISYVKAVITMLDAAQNPIGEPVDCEYLDLHAIDLEAFGSKNAVVLPNSSARAFKVGIKSVAFADGTTWSGEDAEWCAAANDSEIVTMVKVDDVYKEALGFAKSDTEEDLARAIDLLTSIEAYKDVASEIANYKSTLQQAKDKAKMLAKTKKKRKKIIVTSVVSVLVIALAILVVKVFVPEMIWDHADKLYAEGKYEEAFVYVHDAYESGWLPFGAELYYIKAVEKYMEAGKYDEASSLIDEYGHEYPYAFENEGP